MKDGSMQQHEVIKWEIKDFSRLYVVPPLKNGVHYNIVRRSFRNMWIRDSLVVCFFVFIISQKCHLEPDICIQDILYSLY